MMSCHPGSKITHCTIYHETERVLILGIVMIFDVMPAFVLNCHYKHY